MPNTIVCQHPQQHGVSTHLVGSRAAQECVSANRMNKTSAAPSPHLSIPVEAPMRISNSIAGYSMSIKQISDGNYSITTEFQVVAETEDEAYESAESCYPNLEDSGISAVRIEGDNWDVVTSFSVASDTAEDAREFATREFAGTPRWRATLADIRRVSAEQESTGRA